MPTTSRFPWPQRTTLIAGVLLLVSGFLLLLEQTQVAVPVTETFVIPLSGPIVSFATRITRAAAFLVAAIGIAGEIGIAADSRVGRVSLIVWGVLDLVTGLLAPLTIGLAAIGPITGGIGLALTLVFEVAAVVSVVVVVRARVLSGFARWVLLPVAVVECAFRAVSFLPLSALVAIQPVLGSPITVFLDPVLAGATGVAFLLWSRTEAVKHRAKVAYDAW